MPILPRAPGLDVKRLDLLGPQSVLDAGGDKLRPIVAAQVFGHSRAGGGRFDHRDHIDGSDRPPRTNGKALPGVFVQQGKDAKAPSVFRSARRSARALPCGCADSPGSIAHCDSNSISRLPAPDRPLPLYPDLSEHSSSQHSRLGRSPRLR
jgi:hypothetical protein